MLRFCSFLSHFRILFLYCTDIMYLYLCIHVQVIIKIFSDYIVDYLKSSHHTVTFLINFIVFISSYTRLVDITFECKYVVDVDFEIS
ncbi:unnamed protein product, partial [Cylicocyclus nassatus]